MNVEGGGEGISLGSAYLKLYGDRAALDRELAILKRYTDALEQKGIKVKFDADTGKATREVQNLMRALDGVNDGIEELREGLAGDASVWTDLANKIEAFTNRAGQSGGVMSGIASGLGGVATGALRAIPILGQLGLAAEGLQVIFQGVGAAIGSVITPLQALAAEAGRFNQQVAEGSIFAANSFAVLGPDGEAIQGTANQMRALRGTIIAEFRKIQKEVAQISGATSSEVYEGFNLILQNSAALGKEGEDLEKIAQLSTRVAAAMNTLGIPGQQLRGEVQSLMTGDIQMYDELAKKLGYVNKAQIDRLKSEGKYYEDLMIRLNKLYDGQKVLADSLTNVSSNFRDVWESIATYGGQALERGLARSFKAVLEPLTTLQGSFAGAMRAVMEALEPVLRVFGELGGWLVSISSLLGSVVQMTGDWTALLLNIIGAGLLPTLSGIGKLLEIIAKGAEVSARMFSALLRPVNAFISIITDTSIESGIENWGDALIKIMDEIAKKADDLTASIAKPFRFLANQQAWVVGKLGGQSDEEIQQRQAAVQAEFDSRLGTYSAPSLRSLNLSQETQNFLQEAAGLDERSGSGRLARERELSKMIGDRLQNEIRSLEEINRRLQAQRSLQDAINQLAEGRRGLDMSRASFAAQLASSPEARIAAEERRNDLAQRQEQARIAERRQLIGMERQQLQTQLQIQERQQRIQAEQLRIQQMEIEIQRSKALEAQAEVMGRYRAAPAGSPEQRRLYEQLQLATRIVQLRDQQLTVINRTVELGGATVENLREVNGLEQRRLGVQEAGLSVQEQAAGLTREQQRLMADLQRREQDIANTLKAQQNAIEDRRQALEQEKQTIEQRLRDSDQLLKNEKARLELSKAQADAAVDAAQRGLDAARAATAAGENPRSARAVIGAQIEALAAGKDALTNEGEAVRRLYTARQQQLAAEQELQRTQLRIQQERELSELRIQRIQLETLRLQQQSQLNQARAEEARLGLQQQRDAMAGQNPAGYPAVPTLPPPAGGGRGGMQALLALIRSGEGGYESINRGVAGDTPGGMPGLSRMSLAQIMAMQRRGGAFAVGAYQFIPGTFETAMRGAGLTPDATFDRGNQDRMAVALMLGGKRPTLRDFLQGKHGNLDAAQLDLAKEWAAVPTAAGRGYYDGDSAGNRAHLRSAAVRQALLGARGGGLSDLGAAAGANTAESLKQSLDATRITIQGAEGVIKSTDEQIANLNNKLIPSAERRAGQEQAALATTQGAALRNLQAQSIRERLTAEILNTPRGRLAVELTDAITEGTTGVVRGAFDALRNGGSIGDALEQVVSGMAERASAAILDFALAPIEKALTENLFGAIGGFDPKEIEKQVAAELQQAAATQQAAGETLIRAGQTLMGQGSPTGAGGSLSEFLTPGGASFDTGQVFGMPSLLGNMANLSTGLDLRTLQADAKTTATAFSDLTGSLADVPNAAEQANKGFQNVMGGIAGMAAGAMGIYAGISKMGEGGTYNTLTGLAGIFGGIGALAAPFGGGGIFGARAGGGPVASNRAYLVGERGPELFMPDSNGTVVSNERLPFQGGRAGTPDAAEALAAAYGTTAAGALAPSGSPSGWGREGSLPFSKASAAAGFRIPFSKDSSSTASVIERSNRETIEAIAAAGPLELRVETEVINGVEYVTVEQHKRGMQEASSRGRELTLAALQNSVRTRKRVGLG